MKQGELRLVGNGVSELLYQSFFRFKPLQGSVTRLQAWKHLQDNGPVGHNMLIKGQQHPRRKILTSKLSALEKKTWTKELDMYPDFIGAIRDGVYKETKNILVVDTS